MNRIGQLCTYSSFLLASLLLFGSCAKKSETIPVESNLQECKRTKLESQYIVHWKNGQKTLIHEKNVNNFFEKYKPAIQMIEPNYLIRLRSSSLAAASPYDTPVPASSAHDVIHTEAAWKLGFLGQGMTVAVIDTGVAINHPQLRTHLAVNEIESFYGQNHIDDDANGFIDDIYGWNFVSGSPDQNDLTGHGTGMAGIITGMPENRPSLSMAPEAKILSVQFMDQDGGTEYHAHLAMTYALSRKVNIINNSWSISCSQLLKNDFISWSHENVIFVNASGNIPVDVYQMGIIPSSLKLPNNLNAGSLDDAGNISSFSGFGATVNIFAPGELIPTISPNTGWGDSIQASGTSVSTAIVSGAAALIWSAFPDATAAEIVALIEEGAFVEAPSQKILDIKKSLRLGRRRFRKRPTSAAPSGPTSGAPSGPSSAAPSGP